MKRLKGLFKDARPIDQPEGTYSHLLNGIINKDLGAITNEKALESFSSLSGFDVVGHISIEEEVVLFLKNDSTSKISLMSSNGTLSTILDSTLLNFSLSNPVVGIYSINNQNERIIYFTDGLNVPRWLNIDNHSITNDTIYLLSLFPSSPKTIVLDYTGSNDIGGNLNSGVYFVAASYQNEDFVETNIEVLSHPIYLTPDTTTSYDQYDGSTPNFATTKTINIELSNLDTNYRYVQLYLIAKENNILLPVRKLPLLAISSDTLIYSITGTESYTDTTIDILIPKANYLTAKAMTQVDDSLYLGNLTEGEDIGFQKFANSIIVEAVTETVINGLNDIDSSYKKGLLQKKSYQRDEIYAFYISFLLKNGNRSLAYHIPGREAENYPNIDGYISLPDVLPSDPEILDSYAESTGSLVITGVTSTGTAVLEIYNTIGLQHTINISVVNTDTLDILLNKIDAAIDLNTNFILNNNGIDSGTLKAKYVGSAYNGYYINSLTNITWSDIGNNTTSGVDLVESTYTDEIEVISGVSVTYILTAGSSQSVVRNIILAALNAEPLLSDFTFSLDADQLKIKIESSLDETILSVITNNSGYNYSFTNNILGGNEALSTLFRDDANPLANGMAYWENENEIYPDNENYDIWDVNTVGIGVNTGVTLRNKPVRHHHFPEHKYNPFYLDNWNNETGTYSNDINILGFKLTNFKIPNDIAEQVVGYEVFRAKRDETIIGQGNLIFQIDDDEAMLRNVDFYPYGTLEGISIKGNIATINDFNLMRTKRSISQINYCKRVCFSSYELEESKVDSAPYLAKQHYIKNYDRYDYQDIINIDVLAKARIPLDTELVNLSSFGFDKNFQNYRGDSTIALQLDVTNSQLADPTGIHGALINLKINKLNLYNSFFNQLLLSTGYKDIDINNFTIVGGESGRTQYESETIYGGDIFIQKYSHTEHGKPGKNSVTLNTVVTNVVECRDNIGLRHEGEETYEKYYPKEPDYQKVLNPNLDTYSAPFDFYDKIDGWYGYNPDYSQENDFVQIGIFNPMINSVTNRSNRVIRSSGNSLGNVNNYRTFLLEDKLDLPRSKGEIINLENFDNNLLIHTDRTLFITRGREELLTGDVRAYIGSGNIFSSPPKEVFSLQYGYGGLQHPFSKIMTQFGYFFVDQLSKKVYQYTGELKEISFDGLRNEFIDKLTYSFDESSPVNPKNQSIVLGYDTVQSRILITINKRKVENPNDERLTIIDDSHTYSFAPDINNWVSKHSYYPYQYISLRDKFLSIDKNGSINKYHISDLLLPFEFEFVENSNPNELKQAVNINLLYELINSSNKRVLEPLSNYKMTTSYQDSGTINMIAFPTTNHNTRNRQNRWFVSKFRDMLVNGVLDSNKPWYDRRRMLDNYFKVLITYTGNKTLYLYESKVDYDKG